MGQKEGMLAILQAGEALTQVELAQRLYGEEGHTTAIYLALRALVERGKVIRSSERPARYFLPGNAPEETPPEETVPLTAEELDRVEGLLMDHTPFGLDLKLVERCLRRFPDNRDVEVVAMKVGLIDATNATHLAQHKSRIHIDELSRLIAAIPDLDARLAEGDPEVVNEIARSNGKMNLFSFATKYCCYHNQAVYGRDDYSILDTIVKQNLFRYFPDLTTRQISLWQCNFQYGAYRDAIGRELDQRGLILPGRRRKLDHFVWYQNRKKKG